MLTPASEPSSIPVPQTHVFGAIEEPSEVMPFVLKPLPPVFSFFVDDHHHLDAFMAALAVHRTLRLSWSRQLFGIGRSGAIGAEIRVQEPVTIEDVRALIDALDLGHEEQGRATMRKSLAATEIEDNPHAPKA